MRIRFGGRENGGGSDSAGVLMLPRADSAEGTMVLGADFNCSQRDFSAVFQENFRAENEKNGSELMHQIAQKS